MPEPGGAMAAIKLTYIGGGSTRGAGTMASFVEQGSNFEGSEVVLFDIDDTHLELVRRLAQKMVDARGLDITVTATTDRRAALDGADAVLASYRPGGFQARALDEADPAATRRDRPGDPRSRRLLHGVAGDHRDEGDRRGHGRDLPQRDVVQLHEPDQHRGSGGERSHGHHNGVVVRGTHRLPALDRCCGGT